MATVIENRLGSFEKRKEQIRRYELFVETGDSSEEIIRKPKLTVDSKKSKYKIRFPDGCVFLAACSSGSIDDVAELLKNPNTDINTTNVDGLTGLHQACINEDLDMVMFLVDKGININLRDNEGWTALHAAAQSGFIDIAKFLIDRGAKLDIINCDCELPLDLSQSKEMTHLLEEAMRTQGVDGDRARNAEERMMVEDIKRWSELGTYSGMVDEKTGASPLHVAAVKGYLDIMTRLISLGAPIDARDNEGWTPMHGAAHWGQEDACRLLAENYCDLKAVNHQGCTPLDVADPNVVDLLEELLEKQKSLPDNFNISRPSNKARKSSITRISAGHMKDLQRKNEGDEKPPTASGLTSLEDEDLPGDPHQGKGALKGHPPPAPSETARGITSGEIRGDVVLKPGANRDARAPPTSTVGEISENRTASVEKSESQHDEVLSEDRIQFLLEERKKKVEQQRASDTNMVIMRRDAPRPKTVSEIGRPPRQIASDLVRRSGDPSLWRLGFRRSSNSENDLDDIMQSSEIADRIQEECMETDEDKELKRSGEQQASSESQQVADSAKEADQVSTTHQPSLLRPETAAALASIASSHQRLNDPAKRDDANELERKLKAKRARESRRSTQGVTKEDIQRAEDTLRAAHQGLPQSSVVAASENTPSLLSEGGSGDMDSGKSSPVPPPPVSSSATSAPHGVVIDSSVATIIEKWQKKDGGSATAIDDSRTLLGSRNSALESQLPLQKKDYFLPDTLTLYRKISDQPETGTTKEMSGQQPVSSSSNCSKDAEGSEDSTVKSAAVRARRKRESRRSTGKITLDEAEMQTSDPEESDEVDQANQQTAETTASSHNTSASVAPAVSVGPQRYVPVSIESSSASSTAATAATLPRNTFVASGLSSSAASSTGSTFGPHSSTTRLQDSTGTSSTPGKYSFLGRDWRSSLSSSWQNPSPSLGTNVRSSAVLSSYDSLSSSSGSTLRTGTTGTNVPLPIDYQKMWEQEKLENDTLKKKILQLERDLKNAQLQLEVAMAAPVKGFDRIDAMEKRSTERKLSEIEEEKKLLEKKVSSMEEETAKIELIKTENGKLKNENAALIRVISKLSK